MTDDDLSLEDIDNVGPSVADDLEDAGHETVTDVTTATEDDLADISTYIDNRADEILASAEELVGDDESGELSDEELVEELKDGDAEIEETVTEDVDDGAETFDVELELSEEIHTHVIGAVIEEQTRALQRNNYDDEATMVRILETLTEAYVEADGNDRVVEIESLTMDELNLFRQAVSSQMADYRSRSGIPRLWGKLEDVVDDIDEIRDVNHGA